MTKYTFSLKDNNKINNTFCGNTSTNYSKILDDLINADIKEKNPWLFTNSTPKTETIKIKINGNTTNTFDMSDIYKFFNGYKFTNNCPFIKDKIYYLADGTPFYLTDDYITIGFNTYYFYEFGMPTFTSSLSKDIKKTIATIYIDGLKITIKK